MRKIKFRAWNKDTKEMLYENFGGGRLDCDLNDSLYSLCSKNSDYILMQYTGLKDKNGKEIYEGDIAICTKPTAYGGKTIEKDPVVWDEDGSWSISYFFGHCSEYDTVEVIGNIYENPELLK